MAKSQKEKDRLKSQSTKLAFAGGFTTAVGRTGISDGGKKKLRASKLSNIHKNPRLKHLFSSKKSKFGTAATALGIGLTIGGTVQNIRASEADTGSFLKTELKNILVSNIGGVLGSSATFRTAKKLKGMKNAGKFKRKPKKPKSKTTLVKSASDMRKASKAKPANNSQKKLTFIRKGGRIIPIRKRS